MMGMDEDYKIIEKTQEAMDAHGHLYGSSQVFITPEELKALESGKLLAVTVNYEYVVFIGVEGGVVMDCNVTTNFLKEWYRMCKTVPCGKCGLHGNEGTCRFFAQSKPEKAIKIVQEWSDAHPAKTRLSVFLEHYPNCIKYSDGRPKVCAGTLYGISGCVYSPEGCRDCWKCWNMPIEEQVVQ